MRPRLTHGSAGAGIGRMAGTSPWNGQEALKEQTVAGDHPRADELHRIYQKGLEQYVHAIVVRRAFIG